MRLRLRLSKWLRLDYQLELRELDLLGLLEWSLELDHSHFLRRLSL
nr:hypothetical protein [Escherichia coli]